jgi:hypothetical protein
VDIDEVDRKSRELGWVFLDDEDEAPAEITTLVKPRDDDEART